MFKKQQFPDYIISSLANNQAVYAKAKEIYESDYIQDIIIDHHEHQAEIIFDYPSHYLVTIEFLKNGIASTYSCTCQRFEKYSGACEHVLAAMMRLNDFQIEDLEKIASLHQNRVSLYQPVHTGENQLMDSKQNEQQKFYHHLISLTHPEHLSLENKDKQALKFEFVLNIQPSYDGEPKYHFYMRVGVDHLYVVKMQDLSHIAKILLNGMEHYFGKQLTFSEENYFIRPAERRILEYIIQSASFSTQNSENYFYYYTSHSLFEIHPALIREMIELLNKSPFSFVTIGEAPNNTSDIGWKLPLKIATDKEKLPITMSVKKEEDHYVMKSPSLAEDVDEYVLIDSARMIFMADRFYRLNDKEMLIIPELLKMNDEKTLSEIKLDNEQLSHLVSQIMPVVERKMYLNIDEDIKDKIQFEKMQAKINIDYHANVLSIYPFFVYGETTFDLLDKESYVHDDSSIIVRQFEKEEYIARELNNILDEYPATDNAWMIEDTESIAEFMYEKLMAIEELEDIDTYLSRSAENLFYGSQESFPSINIEQNNETSLLDISFETVDISDHDFAQLIQALKSEKKFYRLDSGKIMDLHQKPMQDLKQTLNTLDYTSKDYQENKFELPLYQGLAIYDNDAVQAGEHFRSLVQHLKNPEELHFGRPKLLKADLRPYQQTGYQWLSALDHYGFGGVLADDMGLGKTVQTIAYLCQKVENTQGKFLIICPSSVLYNWAFEFKKFAPDIQIQMISGLAEERQMQINSALADDDTRILLTSYPLIQRDYQLYQGEKFETIVLDESQNVKNASTKTAQAIRQLKRKNVIALSGTPIENHLDELWSLFSIVQPGLFPNIREFRKLPAEEIAKKVDFFILRRLKSDVLTDLPPKMETIEHIELADEQKKLYQIQLNMIRRDVSEMVANETFNQHRIEVLAGMTRLRQICNDPRLIQKGYRGKSAKLERLIEYLEEGLASGKRIVVFSQFTQMLALIRDELDRRKWAYHYLDGQTAKEDRLVLSERFNQGEKDIFLISLRAGGTGLNLTGGDTVILFDSWWNPAVEDQAADRVHRFGQKKKVQVIRFITNGTIEEGISELQEQKRELIDSIIHTDNEKSLKSLTQEDILKVLGVE